MKKNNIRLTESQLHSVIKESVRKVLREEYEYDNDLSYENVYEEALHFISTYSPKVQQWRGIAEALGYRMDTIGPNDMETLKDAIEDAMMDA